MRWLSTRFNHLCWLPAFLLFFYSSSSFSASCTPGYPTSTPSIGYYVVAGITAYKYPSASIGCSSAASVDKFWGEGFTGSGSGTGPTACTVTKTSDGSTNQTSITFINGSCPTGYIASGSQCVQDCAPDCPTAGTKSAGGFSVSIASTSGSSDVFKCADSSGNSCAASCNSGIASYDSNTGMTNVYCSSVTYTGSTCSTSDTKGTSVSSVPSTNTATPVNNPPKSIQDCPSGSGFAQVNNVGMCLQGGTKYDSGSTTSTLSSGGSVSTSSTTTINKDGTTTTTTTTIYKDAGGNVTGTDVSVSGGSVNQTDGNKPGNDKPLNLGPAPTFDGTLPNDPTFNIKTITNPTLSTSIFDVSASCPEPLTFEAMGRSFEITFQPICDLADIIRGIILMMSAIVAIRAVVTK